MAQFSAVPIPPSLETLSRISNIYTQGAHDVSLRLRNLNGELVLNEKRWFRKDDLQKHFLEVIAPKIIKKCDEGGPLAGPASDLLKGCCSPGGLAYLCLGEAVDAAQVTDEVATLCTVGPVYIGGINIEWQTLFENGDERYREIFNAKAGQVLVSRVRLEVRAGGDGWRDGRAILELVRDYAVAPQADEEDHTNGIYHADRIEEYPQNLGNWVERFRTTVRYCKTVAGPAVLQNDEVAGGIEPENVRLYFGDNATEHMGPHYMWEEAGDAYDGSIGEIDWNDLHGDTEDSSEFFQDCAEHAFQLPGNAPDSVRDRFNGILHHQLFHAEKHQVRQWCLQKNAMVVQGAGPEAKELQGTCKN